MSEAWTLSDFFLEVALLLIVHELACLVMTWIAGRFA